MTDLTPRQKQVNEHFHSMHPEVQNWFNKMKTLFHSTDRWQMIIDDSNPDDLAPDVAAMIQMYLIDAETIFELSDLAYTDLSEATDDMDAALLSIENDIQEWNEMTAEEKNEELEYQHDIRKMQKSEGGLAELTRLSQYVVPPQ
jgi:glutamyl-tRNA reductase